MSFIDSTLEALVENYSDRLGLDWKQRGWLLADYQACLPALLEHDEQISLSIDGLRHLGEEGLSNITEILEDEIVPRDLFTLVIQSCEVGDLDSFKTCVAFAEALPGMQEAFLAALNWTTPALLGSLLKDWRENSSLRRLAILYLLGNPSFDNLHLQTFPADTAEELRLLLRSARNRSLPEWLKKPIKISPTHLFRDESIQLDSCRHQLLFGNVEDHARVLEHAWQYILDEGTEAENWVGLFAGFPGNFGDRFVHNLFKKTGIDRRYVVALGWLGKSQHIPELIDLLDDPQLSRIAAHSLNKITGSSPEDDGWQKPGSESDIDSELEDEDLPEYDPDEGFPYPDKNGFLSWWAINGSRFDPEKSYVLGLERTNRNMVALLRYAALAWRPAIGWMLQLQNSGMALDTEAHALQQMLKLSRFESKQERTA